MKDLLTFILWVAIGAIIGGSCVAANAMPTGRTPMVQQIIVVQDDDFEGQAEAWGKRHLPRMYFVKHVGVAYRYDTQVFGLHSVAIQGPIHRKMKRVGFVIELRF